MSGDHLKDMPSFWGGIYSINQPLESFEIFMACQKLTPVLRLPKDCEGLEVSGVSIVSGSGFFGKMCLDRNLGIALNGSLLWLGIGLPRLLLKSLAPFRWKHQLVKPEISGRDKKNSKV